MFEAMFFGLNLKMICMKIGEKCCAAAVWVASETLAETSKINSIKNFSSERTRQGDIFAIIQSNENSLSTNLLHLLKCQ